MKIQQIQESFICRVIQSTRTYKRPHDIKPDGSIIKPGCMFCSDSQYASNQGKLFHISSAMTSSDDTLPIGQYISESCIDYTILESDNDDTTPTVESDDSIACNEVIFINGSNVILYNTSTESTAVKGSLNIGSHIKVDKKINVNCDGVIQTRYRICEILDGVTNTDIIGKWILGNYSISTDSGNIIIRNSAVRATAYTSVNTLDTDTTDAAKSEESTDDASATNTTEDGETVSTGNEEELVNLESAQRSFSDLYESYGLYGSYTSESLMDIPLGRMIFVHGMPFQFTHYTDRRNGSHNLFGKETGAGFSKNKNGTGSDSYGRTFAKEIVANMPIATIVPGKPTFLTNVKQSLTGYAGSSNKAKNAWIPLWSDLTDTEFESVLTNLGNELDGKVYQYYSMEVDTEEYFNYVNAIAQTSARLMGLEGFTYWGDKCTSLDWGKYNSSADQDYNIFEEVIGLSGGVAFAFDPMSSITDTLTNSTGESAFAGLLNGLSSKARELDFIGGSAGLNLSMVNMEDYTQSVADVDTGWFSTPKNMLSRITSFIENSLHGFNVRFPLIWNDSSFQKSYDIDMKFITPYATTFCKWRYVLVPFIHIFCLAAPKSDDSIVSYKRPFLIRAFSKGYFNVEMGIIESLTWKRFGDGDMISEDGIPTQIDVSVSFQDLYQQLAMSQMNGSTLHSVDFSRIGVFFNNTGLMDLIGTMSGVNMNRISLGERLSLYASSAAGAFSRTGSNFMRHASDRVRNIAEKYIVGI